ncbi:MAG: hypothetical protein ACI4TK_04285 [Agathobacter sp.]
MERKERLWDALLNYVNASKEDTIKGGLSISVTTEDIFDVPFVKELNIKFRYIDRKILKEYQDGQRTKK